MDSNDEIMFNVLAQQELSQIASTARTATLKSRFHASHGDGQVKAKAASIATSIVAHILITEPVCKMRES